MDLVQALGVSAACLHKIHQIVLDGVATNLHASAMFSDRSSWPTVPGAVLLVAIVVLVVALHAGRDTAACGCGPTPPTSAASTGR